MTPTVLSDVVDPVLLDAMLAEGYVRKQVHPTDSLTILNYTEKAAYEAVWNPATKRCRGLIYNHATMQVLARPFPKFMNHGQTGAPLIGLNERCVVTDKLDGSLGILYAASDGWAVATRGSFASEQAIHATEVLRTRYADYEPPAGVTVLFEIVYPTNRIVVDYGDLDDLLLLGAVDIATGRTYSAAGYLPGGWPGPVTDVFPHDSLADALAAPPRPNREGLVVHAIDSDERLKLKQEDYVALHRIVTGLTARTVWQHLVDGKPLADLIAPLPDEFHDWVRSVADALSLTVQVEHERLDVEYRKLVEQMPDGWTPGDRPGRAEFARTAAQHPDSWAMFAQLDGKDIRPKLLHNAKPEPYLTPSGRTFTEDTA